MAKNILQDIVPPERRSIRNVPLPSRRTPRSPQQVINADVEFPRSENSNFNQVPPNPPSTPPPPKIYPYEQYSGNSPRYSKKAIWIACVLAIFVVLFSLASIFSGATIEVALKQNTVSIPEGEFTAFQGSSGSGIPFEVIKMSKDIGRVIPAEGEEQVEQKASGQIVIYNDFDGNDQRLIKNTRFMTPEGLIYRVNESVVVPGRKTSGGTSIPGSVEVTVYADEPGEKYNIDLKDFTIPGFKGDPRHEKIYARSKTEMKGGFVGIMKKVSESQLSTARTEISEEIRMALKQEVRAQIPSDFVSFEQGIFFDFEPLPQSEAGGNSVQVNERGTIKAIMFNKNILSEYLAESLVPEMASSSKVSIINIETLPINISEGGSFDPSTSGTFSFSLTGEVTFVGEFDESALITDLLGRHKKEIPSILEVYPAIQTADAIIKPVWKRTLPKNSEDISIKIISTKTQ